jgi:hypothetical protein
LRYNISSHADEVNKKGSGLAMPHFIESELRVHDPQLLENPSIIQVMSPQFAGSPAIIEVMSPQFEKRSRKERDFYQPQTY